VTFKKEILNFIGFLERQVERFKVQCHLNSKVTPDTIKQIKPDVVLLATGAIPAFPSVEGIENKIVFTIDDILCSDKSIPQKTVVIGGGAAGCEIAFHLCKNGSSVAIVEILPEIGGGLETMTKKILLKDFKENNVRIITESKLFKVKDNGIVVIDKNKNKIFIETQRVVIAIGYQSDNRLYDQIKSSGYEIHRIGDCLEARSAKEAIYEGMVLGCSI